MTLYRELQGQPRLIKLNLILLFLLFVSVTLLLWPHWQHNPDLSHGMFMPVLFFLLLRESRLQGTRYLGPHRGLNWLTAVSLLMGLTAMTAGGLYSASVGWSHTLVAFSLTVAAALFFLAGLLVLSNREVRLLPLNWTSLVAIGLWLLSAPIPPGTYSRITLSLQLMVSQNVLSALHMLGIPASRHGNIIELATTSVGVAEACSGVRSLISCIFAGFFFSATLVTKPWARVLMVLLAAPLAVMMNFLRSLILTLMANRGVDISGTWHDVTGFAVLGVTAMILGGIALFLDQRKPNDHAMQHVAPATTKPAMHRAPQRLLTVGLFSAALVAAFFFINTRPISRAETAPPNLLAMLPSAAEGWHVTTSSDIYQFSGILETDNLAQRTYRKRSGTEEIQLTVYLAFWQAGQSSVSQVAMHTPDACWPGSGWSVMPNTAPRETLKLSGLDLPVAESRVFRSGPYPQHVWFWHVYDGRPIAYEDPYSAAELLRIAWRHGFTRSGDQLFVRVSSNANWDQLAAEPLLQQIFQNLRPLGL